MRFVSRRNFIKTVVVGAAAASPLQRTWGQEASKDGEYLVFAGTYSNGKTDGIFVKRLDKQTGELLAVNAKSGAINPSFLAVASGGKFLYAVNETSNFNGRKVGAVSAYAIDPETKALTLLNQQSAQGESPCYVTIDKTGKWILIANYSSGNAAVLPILEDGSLGPASSIVQHKGSSVNTSRQSEPHAHSITLSPDNRFAFVCDLGLDKIMIYHFDAGEGKLTPSETPFAKTADGSGPRHFAFHPNGKLAFVIHELNSTIASFAYDAGKGTLAEIQTVSALPDGYNGVSYCADIHIHPSGKFLYGSNRGHDSIVIFAVNETGNMTLVGHESTQGKYPRNFAVDPTGSILLAANQNSNTVVSFRIDANTGKLEATGKICPMSQPVCLKFYPAQIGQQSGISLLPMR